MVCTNLYRRHGMYWWRRRLRLPNGQRFTVALSLGTRDPKVARFVSHCVSVEVDDMLQVEECTQQDFRETLRTFIMVLLISTEN